MAIVERKNENSIQIYFQSNKIRLNNTTFINKTK